MPDNQPCARYDVDMCGRYALKTSTPELARMLGVDISSVPDAGAELESSYNVAPSQPIVSCYVDKMGDRRLARMRWGLIPSWSKDGSSKFSMINARAETITEKPSYRTPFRFRRCLVSRGWLLRVAQSGVWQATVFHPDAHHAAVRVRGHLGKVEASKRECGHFVQRHHNDRERNIASHSSAHAGDLVAGVIRRLDGS